ncbi:hypothetical protein [Armatimonas rosea]|uniref:Uncharacterized protein n=1 Tax=Armatimonas rosea TaxID=685828 RepID=A0A7W9W627_ARMRO|nr:hypothetical protein [Armatimonas rosea]MBB6049696.1 hypothetical protein [Armatimonas rosea]
MAIEHFERPFTDDERDTLQDLVAHLEQELAEPPKRRPGARHPRTVHLRVTALLLFALIVLAQDPTRLHFWCLVILLSLVFLWWGYPQRRHAWELREVEREEMRTAWRPPRERTLSDARLALQKGTIHEARLTADALVAFDDDEYFLGFYRVEERLWLCLEALDDWPVRSEFTICWHEARWPYIATSSGNALEIIKPQWEDDSPAWELVSWENGDLFELSLDELLTVTPQVFGKALRGNLFSSPAR